MVSMTLKEMTARIVKLEVDNGITKTELIDALYQIEAQIVAMGDAVEREFVSVKFRLGNIGCEASGGGKQGRSRRWGRSWARGQR